MKNTSTNVKQTNATVVTITQYSRGMGKICEDCEKRKSCIWFFKQLTFKLFSEVKPLMKCFQFMKTIMKNESNLVTN